LCRRAAARDETTVVVIEMETSSEVRSVGFHRGIGRMSPLLIRQKPDRHQRFLSTQICKSLNFCRVCRTLRFAGDFDLQNSDTKVHLFARIFAMAGSKI